jgi:hypothetical protein
MKFIWKTTKSGNLSMAHAGLRAVLFEGKRGWGYGLYLSGQAEPVWGPRFQGEGEARAAAEIELTAYRLKQEAAKQPPAVAVEEE